MELRLSWIWSKCNIGFSVSFGFYYVRDNSWADATKFLTGASAVGSIAIPVILKHAGVIGWGAMAMELSSFFVFVLAIMCFIGTSEDDGYSILWIWLFKIQLFACAENVQFALFLMIALTIAPHIVLCKSRVTLLFSLNEYLSCRFHKPYIKVTFSKFWTEIDHLEKLLSSPVMLP